VENVACTGGKRIACRFTVSIPERKRPFGRHRLNVKVKLKWILEEEDTNWLTGLMLLGSGKSGAIL
jgi:hypothetical protein